MIEKINNLYNLIHNFGYEDVESAIERNKLVSDPEGLPELCFIGSCAAVLLKELGISWIKLTSRSIDGKITKKRLK